MLHSPAAIDLGLPTIIDPQHTKLDDALGLDDATQQAIGRVAGLEATNGQMLVITSDTACKNSGWPGSLAFTDSRKS